MSKDLKKLDFSFDDEIEALTPNPVSNQFVAKSELKQQRFEKALKVILPHLGGHEGKIALAQVMISLKVDGVIDADLSDQDIDMVRAIKDALMSDPEKMAEAMKITRKLLSSGE